VGWDPHSPSTSSPIPSLPSSVPLPQPWCGIWVCHPGIIFEILHCCWRVLAHLEIKSIFVSGYIVRKYWKLSFFCGEKCVERVNDLPSGWVYMYKGAVDFQDRLRSWLLLSISVTCTVKKTFTVSEVACFTLVIASLCDLCAQERKKAIKELQREKRKTKVPKYQKKRREKLAKSKKH